MPDDLRRASQSEQAAASEHFRTRPHEVFCEVKWFHRGSPKWDKHNWREKVLKGVPPDLKRLGGHLNAGRCQVAAMLIVDDTGEYWHRIPVEIPCPEGVHLLMLHPPQEGSNSGGGDATFWADMLSDD